MGLIQVSYHLVWCWLLFCCILLLLSLGMGLQFLFFPRLLPWQNDEFCQMNLQHIMKCRLFFLWVCLCSNFIDGFPHIEHPCIPGFNPTWSWWMIILICSWIQLVVTLLSIFALVFIMDFGLVSFFVGSFCGFGISVIVAS